MDICVYCGSDSRIGEPFTSAVEALGRAMGSHGHGLVFGGYDSGLMGTIARAVHEGGGHVLGVVPDDLDSKTDRVVFPCDEVVRTATLAERKTVMEQRADAFVAAPGSYGTLDELYEVLAQQKAHTARPKPIALLNVEGFYDGLQATHRQMAERGFMTPEVAKMAYFSDDPEAIVAHIEAGA
jgi:uncharacterized protein (TIGR00730 family)